MGALDEIVAECRGLEAKGATEADARRIYSYLASLDPSAKAGLNMFRARLNGSLAYTRAEAAEDVRRLRMKAEVVRDRWAHEEELARLAATRQSLAVEQHASASASAEASSAVDFALDALAGLPDDEQEKGEVAVERARRAARKGDEKGFAERAKDAIEVASKAAGAVPAVVKALGAIASLFP